MPGLAEDPLYGVDADPENGTPATDSIWDEIVTEAGDIAVAVTQGLFGQPITPDTVTYATTDPAAAETEPVSTSWLWWAIAGLALLAIIILFVYKKKN